MNKIISKVEKDNKEAFKSLYEGENESLSDFKRGSIWYNWNLPITDGQVFSSQFLNGFLEEERNNRIEVFYNREEI